MVAVRCPHQWQDGWPSSSARLFFLNSAVFLVLGFVLRAGVLRFGDMVFLLARPVGLAFGFVVVVIHGRLDLLVCVLFSMLVRCEIKPNAITPHPLPSIGFPIQNHLPSVVLPRALSTHAYRVLPVSVAPL